MVIGEMTKDVDLVVIRADWVVIQPLYVELTLSKPF